MAGKVDEAILMPDWPAPSKVQAVVVTRSHSDEASAGTRQGLKQYLSVEPLWLDQVHGSAVVAVDELAAEDHTPVGDAATTRQAGKALAIRTADCLPVLFCHRSEPVIAAAHAGWRGLAAGVLENTVQAMQVEPRNLLAWLGPAIGQQAFEVGPEVRQAFLEKDEKAASAFIPGAGDRWHGDLYELARQRLASAGVESVYGGGFCTYTEQERFYSYRRNPDCGRMVSLIWMTAN